MTDIFPKFFFLLINYKRLRIHTIVAFSFVRKRIRDASIYTSKKYRSSFYS